LNRLFEALDIMPLERLQKIIAAAGIASRRKAEELISSGRVQVNGKVVTELGTKADAESDHVRVNGKLLHGAQRHTYLLLNKPKGYVTTMSDPEERPTVMDLIRGVKGRVYPVGRLDYASEGLLLLTNDGDLAHRLMKAASHVSKTYLVKVAGTPNEDAIAKLRAGISIATDDGKRVKTGPAVVRIVKHAANPWYEITLIEGRNRQIRRMFEAVGHHVEKIKRVRYGPLTLDVPPGEFRQLTLKEVQRLKSACGMREPARERSAS
jgi:23S rRNA pseudouridine2605 synthase